MGRQGGPASHALITNQRLCATDLPKSKIELINANSVFKEITRTHYCGATESPTPHEITAMQTSATVIDFTLHRKRRQARAAAELMWSMYAARAGLAVFTAQATSSSDTRRA